jgi:hypothetical protein
MINLFERAFLTFQGHAVKYFLGKLSMVNLFERAFLGSPDSKIAKTCFFRFVRLIDVPQIKKVISF